MQYFVFKLLLSCAECGGRIVLEGPTLAATCPSCKSTVEVQAKHWKPVLELYRDAAEFELVPGKTRGSAFSSGEFQLLIRWGPARPSCSGCGADLPVEAVPPGGDGKLMCPCGEVMHTFPPPKWLREQVPSAVQLFGATRDGQVGTEAGNASPGLTSVAHEAAHKPVLWSCPRCGAGLDISAESPRILTCRYCESDLYLPDPLWHALHPVKKRAPFWVAFRD